MYNIIPPFTRVYSCMISRLHKRSITTPLYHSCVNSIVVLFSFISVLSETVCVCFFLDIRSYGRSRRSRSHDRDRGSRYHRRSYSRSRSRSRSYSPKYSRSKPRRRSYSRSHSRSPERGRYSPSPVRSSRHRNRSRYVCTCVCMYRCLHY